MNIILSIVAAVIGAMLGGPFGGFWLGATELKRKLLDYETLCAFWSERFAPHGGVKALFETGRPDRPPPRVEDNRRAILVEYNLFPTMRRVLFPVILILAGIWYWVSLHYSFWILGSYLFWVVLSVLLYPKTPVNNALVDIFRAVRLWMWVDRRKLLEEAPSLGIVEVERVLSTMEPNSHPIWEDQHAR